MKTVLVFGVLLVIFAMTFSHPTKHINLDEEWENFKQIYGRKYFDEDIELTRKAIFSENLRKVYRHNDMYKKGLVTFKLTINNFSDKTNDELVPKQSISQDQENFNYHEGVFVPPKILGELPTEVDWRKHGLVSKVKNQGSCGSCWVFSGIGALEGQQARKTGKMVELSEQNVIDCTKHKHGKRGGCNGGREHKVFILAEEKGIDTEESYPYEAGDENKCRFKDENVGAVATGFNRIKEGNEADMMIALATVGPLAIALDVSDNLHAYHKGVYESVKCRNFNKDLKHSLLAVGYGTTEEGQDYWLVKNSWGENWGDQGYLKIARNKGNMCGIATSVSYPLV